MGEAASESITREEEIEDCRVEWLERGVTEIIIVSLNLRALEVMGLADKHLDDQTVFFAPVFEAQILVFKPHDVHGDEEAVELLFLVSLTVLLDDNSLSKMLQKLILEVIQVLC